MNDRFVILSDIHGNLSALDAVLVDFEARGYQPDGIVLLGDNVNYGMRPNEVIERLIALGNVYAVMVNLCGNHEKALLDGDTERFSTERGKQVLAYTKSRLKPAALDYIGRLTKAGYAELVLNGRRLLFVHGTESNPFWGKMDGAEMSRPIYAQYDYVISGHSHIPDMTEKFYETADRPDYRNKKRTVFLNPGSVGQPRNHNPRAQYLYVDFLTETFHFNTVAYDVKAEQSLYIMDEIDGFYKTRLANGV